MKWFKIKPKLQVRILKVPPFKIGCGVQQKEYVLQYCDNNNDDWSTLCDFNTNDEARAAADNYIHHKNIYPIVWKR